MAAPSRVSYLWLWEVLYKGGVVQETATQSKGPGVGWPRATVSPLLPGPQLCVHIWQLPLSGPMSITHREGRSRAWGQERGSAAHVGVEGREGE